MLNSCAWFKIELNTWPFEYLSLKLRWTFFPSSSFQTLYPFIRNQRTVLKLNTMISVIKYKETLSVRRIWVRRYLAFSNEIFVKRINRGFLISPTVTDHKFTHSLEFLFTLFYSCENGRLFLWMFLCGQKNTKYYHRKNLLFRLFDQLPIFKNDFQNRFTKLL